MERASPISCAGCTCFKFKSMRNSSPSTAPCGPAHTASRCSRCHAFHQRIRRASSASFLSFFSDRLRRTVLFLGVVVVVDELDEGLAVIGASPEVIGAFKLDRDAALDAGERADVPYVFAIEERAADDKGCSPIVVEPNRAFVIPPVAHPFRLPPGCRDAAAAGGEVLRLLAARERPERARTRNQDNPCVGGEQHESSHGAPPYRAINAASAL